MQSLCRAFIQTVVNRDQCQLILKELMNVTGVKRRRISDFINILEGCDFVTKISKGHYCCLGFSQQKNIIRDNQAVNKGPYTIMSNLAAKVKEILVSTRASIDFKTMCSKVFDEFQIPQKDMASYRRRIYECCKILNILGVVSKDGHQLEWIQPHQRRKHLTMAVEQEKTMKKARKYQTHSTINTQSRIFKRLLRDVSTKEDFLEIAERLQTAFNMRLQEAIRNNRIE